LGLKGLINRGGEERLRGRKEDLIERGEREGA